MANKTQIVLKKINQLDILDDLLTGYISNKFERNLTNEHFGKNKKSTFNSPSNVINRLLNKRSYDSFPVLDTANNKRKLKINETFYISWLKSNLNKQNKFLYTCHFAGSIFFKSV